LGTFWEGRQKKRKRKGRKAAGAPLCCSTKRIAHPREPVFFPHKERGGEGPSNRFMARVGVYLKPEGEGRLLSRHCCGRGVHARSGKAKGKRLFSKERLFKNTAEGGTSILFASESVYRGDAERGRRGNYQLPHGKALRRKTLFLLEEVLRRKKSRL